MGPGKAECQTVKHISRVSFLGWFTSSWEISCVNVWTLHIPQPLGGPLANRNLVHEVGSCWQSLKVMFATFATSTKCDL